MILTMNLGHQMTLTSAHGLFMVSLHLTRSGETCCSLYYCLWMSWCGTEFHPPLCRALGTAPHQTDDDYRYFIFDLKKCDSKVLQNISNHHHFNSAISKDLTRNVTCLYMMAMHRLSPHQSCITQFCLLGPHSLH
jgi:hypothetical protein